MCVIVDVRRLPPLGVGAILEVRLGDATGLSRRIVDDRGDGRGMCDCDIDLGLVGVKSCGEVGDTMTQSPP